jgi:hypothetical protein
MAKPKHECNPLGNSSLLLAMRDTIHLFFPRNPVLPIEMKENIFSGLPIHVLETFLSKHELTVEEVLFQGL